MQDSIIRPKYSFKSLWDVLLLTLGLIVTIIFAAVRSGFGLETFSLLITLIGFCIRWTSRLIRYFTFAQSSFTVIRYILPSKTINYVDITDISVEKIKTKNGNINFAGMTHVGEILQKFNDLIIQGNIDPNQFEEKISNEELIWRKSLFPSAVISILFWILLFYYWPFHRVWFSPIGLGISCGLIFSSVTSIVQRIAKKRLKDQKAG